MTSPVFRFAPSSNGALHLGHAYSALHTARLAKETGGRFLLRIEDIDAARARPEYEQGILDDLAWLGLEWEQPVRRQSEHMGDYAAALEKLEEMGLVYPCFATRAEIAAAASADALTDPDGAALYPGIWRGRDEKEVAARMENGEPFALRLAMDKALARAKELHPAPLAFTEEEEGPQGQHGVLEIDPGIWGDVVIARKEVPTSYHLAVVVDDALQGVTHVTRGQDLFHATHIHRLLQVLLGLAEPRYRHHALIRDGEGRKLAKSARDTSLKSLRAAGVHASDILRRLGFAQ